MAPLRGRRNVGGCRCWDCAADNAPSRTYEKRAWRAEVDDELYEPGRPSRAHGWNGVALCGCGCGRRD